jgi:hypothetical protein
MTYGGGAAWLAANLSSSTLCVGSFGLHCRYVRSLRSASTLANRACRRTLLRFIHNAEQMNDPSRNDELGSFAGAGGFTGNPCRYVLMKLVDGHSVRWLNNWSNRLKCAGGQNQIL